MSDARDRFAAAPFAYAQGMLRSLTSKSGAREA